MSEKVDRYQILEEIGRGGFATVYRARDIELERLVALKELHPHLLADSDCVERFRREARLIARLNHPHIVPVQASLAALDKNESPGLDLTYQVANLLIPLARLDDRTTAIFAECLISNYPANQRMLRELANALAEGRGPETLAVLKGLKSRVPAMTEEVEHALDRHKYGQKDHKPDGQK